MTRHNWSTEAVVNGIDSYFGTCAEFKKRKLAAEITGIGKVRQASQATDTTGQSVVGWGEREDGRISAMCVTEQTG